MCEFGDNMSDKKSYGSPRIDAGAFKQFRKVVDDKSFAFNRQQVISANTKSDMKNKSVDANYVEDAIFKLKKFAFGGDTFNIPKMALPQLQKIREDAANR